MCINTEYESSNDQGTENLKKNKSENEKLELRTVIYLPLNYSLYYIV